MSNDPIERLYRGETKTVRFSGAEVFGSNTPPTLTLTWSLSSDEDNASPLVTGSLAEDSPGEFSGEITAANIATAAMTFGETYYVHLLATGKVWRTIPVIYDRHGAR